VDHGDEKLEATGGCRTCLAIPGKIIEITSDATHSALVDVMGVRRKVDLGLLQEDKPKTGDWVLIHVGFAMSKISEEEGLDQMHTLQMLGESEAAIAEVRGYGLEDVEEKRITTNHLAQGSQHE
jgi:hydrogenase expression/formation protein HypC